MADSPVSNAVPYDSDYYVRHRDGARRSADVIVPLVLALVHARQVIDVGCGTGTWLAVFRACGVCDIWGVDGPWVDPKSLEIPRDRFAAADLREPYDAGRMFDLAVSLEVAEHLPAASADTFIRSLTALAPVVLFSAAVPFQGGADHLNEQWPEYWARLFAARGFVAVDALRRKVWRHPDVEWWYAQNMLLFARPDRIAQDERLRREYEATAPAPMAVVHPTRFLEWVQWALAPERARARDR